MTEIEIKIPENWSEIKLPQYLAFYKAVKPYEGTSEYGRVVFERSVLHFCNISSEVLYKLPTQTLDEIKTTLTNFLADGMKLMFLDKHGACSVLSAFQTIVEEKLKVNVTCSMGFV